MKILLTNDDGIDAPGLAALEKAVASLGDVTVVAPVEPHSGCGHRVNVSHPLACTERSPGRLALNSAPADCTRIGLTQIVPEAQWVIAGINHGGNLGIDVYMSGTVAAVREAALLGKQGIAISQYHRGKTPVNWATAENMVQAVLERIWGEELLPGEYWNVNLPDPADFDHDPEIIFCPLDTNAHPVIYDEIEGAYHYRGDYHQRPRLTGSDVDVCFSGGIAISRVVLEGGRQYDQNAVD